MNRSSTHPALYVVRHIKKLLALQYIDIKIGHPSLRCSDLFFSFLLWYCVCVCVCADLLYNITPYATVITWPSESSGASHSISHHRQEERLVPRESLQLWEYQIVSK